MCNKAKGNKGYPAEMRKGMKRITCIFLVFCLCLNLAGCTNAGDGGEGLNQPASQEAADKALKLAYQQLKKMTLEEKIGQMFIVDLDKLTDDKPVTDFDVNVLEKIEKYKLGGVILGKQNVLGADQIKSLTQWLRESVQTSTQINVPLYIGTQEEGGGDKSIAAANDDITSTGYTSPSEMGENMTESQFESTGERIADELLELGFNLNLAPKADVTEQQTVVNQQEVSGSAISVIGEKPVQKTLGKKASKAKKKKNEKAYKKELETYNAKWDAFMKLYREDNYADSCFGADEDKAGEAVAAMITGMHSTRAADMTELCTVMNVFPGISSVAQYHQIIPTQIDTGVSRLRRVNLTPFEAGIEAGTDFVMVGHVILSKIDPSELATVSKTIITKLLRKELGFEGVILTEQMDVPVITNQYSTGQAVIKAIVAGADMIYNPQNLDEAMYAVKRAVMFGEIDEKVINQAVLRILQNKYMRGICGGLADDK